MTSPVPLVNRVLRHAMTTPEQIALSVPGATVSWGEFGASVAGLAGRLLSAGVRPDEPVGVLARRDAGYLIGAMAVMAAGAAFVPLDPDSPPKRLAELAGRARIRIGVGDAGRLPFLERVEPAREEGGLAPPAPARTASPLAYALFTSGTTGEPHVVAIEQSSVTALLDGYESLAPARSRVVSSALCPFSFDVSIWEIFTALATGGTVVVLDTEQARDPVLLVDRLIAERVTTSYLPPALLDAVADEFRHRGTTGSLERLLTGVEPVPQRTLGQFLELDPHLAVVNGYGPTETTVCCTMHRFRGVDEPDRRTPIGTEIPGWRVRVVDEGLADVGIGMAGEILVGGAGLARGYLDDPELTRQRFITHNHHRYYRTGDLGRWLPDGTIEFIGRRDHQVKIRGFRVELGDVETALLKHPHIRAAVATAEPTRGGHRLTAFLVPHSQHRSDPAAIRHWLTGQLPDYLIPARLITLDAIPLTANGKTDRAVLTALARTRPATAEYEPPPPGTATILTALWSRTLDIDRIGIHDNFFDLGGDSVTAIGLVAGISRQVGLPGQSSRLLACHTIAEQSAEVERLLAGAGEHAAPRPAPGEPAELTVGQQGLLTRQQMHPDDHSFILPVALRICGEIDAGRIAGCLDAVLSRHRALLTRIAATIDGVRQHEQELPPTEVLDGADEAALPGRLEQVYAGLAAGIARLEGPLTRSAIVPLRPAGHVILVVAHHLVIDGTSVPRLVADLSEALEGRQVTGSAGTAAFAHDQRHSLSGPAADQARAYWRDVFAAEEEALELPLVRGRPARRSGRGEALEQRLRRDAADALGALAARLRVSSFAVVLAGVVAVAQRFTAQRDVVVSTPMATDRSNPLIGDAVGYYANMAPVRVAAGPETSFPDLVTAAAAALDAARTHGWYPFEELLGLLPGSRSSVADRLTRLVVAQDVDPGLPRAAGNLVLTEEQVRTGTAKYELCVFVRESPDGRHRLVWEYDAEVFDLPTVRRFAATLERVLVAGRSDRPVGRLDLLGLADRELIARANETQTPYPADAGILDLFDEQVALTPDATAMAWSGGTISYAQLDTSARDLAERLSARGVGEESPVLVLCERSPAFVTAVLGVLRAGGSYLPLDGRNPSARVAQVGRQAGAAHCVYTAGLRELVPEWLAGHMLAASGCPAGTAPVPSSRPGATSASGPGHRAYVMFTSGSTGTPKGVEIEDRAVIRLVRGQRLFPIASDDRLVLASALAFDAVTLEVWGALLNGARLVIPDEPVLRDPAELASLIGREGVTLGFFNVSVFRLMLDAAPDKLRGMHTILVGGEQVPAALIEKAAGLLGAGSLLNGYGPTENTTFSCTYRLSSAGALGRTFPVGAAISNSTARVVDEGLADVGIGMAGEILVGGVASLARGYLDDPELTRQRFITHNHHRYYRTGDLGRWLPDGTIEFIGRRDHQVKIRGFRVELGDVETALLKHPHIRAAVATAEPTRGGHRLTAFLVPHSQHRSDPAAIRHWLTGQLPDYLIPARLITLDAIPLTANGKTDRAVLTALARTRPATAEYEPPPPGTATILTALWSRTLDIDRIGIHDNFFDLGGDSRTVAELVARIRAEFDCELRVVDFLDAPTVDGLARRLETQRTAANGTDPLHEQAARRAAMRARRRR